MPDITLPTTGQVNWDIPLDAALTTVDNDAANALTNISNHSNNVPADPHGDRAFANSLVAPITSGTNGPNGYVKLDGSGHIPASLITGTTAGGLYTNVYDAVGQFGMFTGTTDTSVKLQNALTAAGNAGGGIVYVGPGTYSLGNYVIIGSNTWLMLAEGCILQRIAGAGNPPYIISNVQFGTNNTPTTNFKITGGKLDAVGTQSLGSACTPIFFIKAQGVIIRDVFINAVFNNPCIEVNGSNVVNISSCHLGGPGSNLSQPTVPAIRINSAEASTTPAGLASGLYDGSTSFIVKITDCVMTGSGSIFGNNGSFCATDLAGTHINQDITITSVSTRYNSINSTPVDSSHWQNFSVINCNFNETNANNTGSEWNSITLKNGYTVDQNEKGNNYTPAYKMMPDGQLAIRGALSPPGGASPDTTWGSVPSAFGNTQSQPPTAMVVDKSGIDTGIVYLDGVNLKFHGAIGNVSPGTIYLDCLLRI